MGVGYSILAPRIETGVYFSLLEIRFQLRHVHCWTMRSCPTIRLNEKHLREEPAKLLTQLWAPFLMYMSMFRVKKDRAVSVILRILKKL